MTSDKKQDVTSGDAAIAGWQLVLVVASSLVRAFVLVALWRWFATPFALPELTFAHAFGLLLLAATFKGVPPKDDRSAAETIRASLFISGALLLFGWVASHFVGD